MAPAEQVELDPATNNPVPAQDTLMTSDKRDVGYLLPSADANSVLPIASTAVRQTRSRPIAGGISPGPAGLNANRVAVKLPKPRPKIRFSKKNNPAQAAGDLRGCTQPGGLGGILLSLSGSLRCG